MTGFAFLPKWTEYDRNRQDMTGKWHVYATFFGDDSLRAVLWES